MLQAKTTKIIGFYASVPANFPKVGRMVSESILLVLEGIENKIFKVHFWYRLLVLSCTIFGQKNVKVLHRPGLRHTLCLYISMCGKIAYGHDEINT